MLSKAILRHSKLYPLGRQASEDQRNILAAFQ